MAGKSRFIKALTLISSHFKSLPQKVFKEGDLHGVLEENREKWGLAAGMAPKKFIEELLKYTDLQIVDLESVGQQSYTPSRLIRYSYGASVFEIALSIRANSHLSHYSSVFLLGLTQQIPKTIYVTFEQAQKKSIYMDAPVISQNAIDNAFSKPQRVASHYYSFLDYKIILLNSKFTKNAGVFRLNSIFGQNLSITSLERTLIDITVRPAYSGGVTEVLKAYQEAKQSMSVNKLTSILDRINYNYPYRQAIGFYLQKAGYKEFQIAILKSYEMYHDFYLTYEMKDPEYSKEWRLYYPKNF